MPEDEAWNGEESKEKWAKRHNLQESGGRTCIHRLIGKRCTLEHGCSPPAGDHCSLWLDRSTGKPKVFVSQPYSFYGGHLWETQELCERLGLTFSISTYPAWHYPGHVLFIEYEKKNS